MLKKHLGRSENGECGLWVNENKRNERREKRNKIIKEWAERKFWNTLKKDRHLGTPSELTEDMKKRVEDDGRRGCSFKY